MPIMGQYEYIIDFSHQRANRDGQVYLHVIVAENKLGRSLLKGETVHHIDMNKLNNKENNLLVFINRAEHARFHYYKCNNEILELTQSGAYKCSLLSKSICPSCHKEKDKHGQLCKKCYDLLKNRKVLNRPNREILKELIYTQTFVSIGQMYGITDNAIKKWCKSYNLPARRKDIKLYSIEEWKKI